MLRSLAGIWRGFLILFPCPENTHAKSKPLKIPKSTPFSEPPSITICNIGVWRWGWLPRVTLQGRNIVFSFHFVHFAFCTARNVESTYALFFHFEPGSADDVWNTLIFVTLCIERNLMSFHFWELRFPFWCQDSVLNMVVRGFPKYTFKGNLRFSM